VKSDSGVTLYSRNGKSLSRKFPYIVEALRGLSDGTVVDGELVALDDLGRPEDQNASNDAVAVDFSLCCSS
jgi:ATP-dependent DNA ligase